MKNNMSIYNSNKNFYSIVQVNENSIINEKGNNLLESKSNKYTIFKQKDFRNGVNYVMLSGEFDNGYYLYIRIPVSSIKDSVRISNNF